MWLDAALSIAHFIFVLILAGALAGELFVMRLAPSPPVLRLLSRIDLFYGISAVGVLAAGLGRVFWGLKDASYYGASHAFWGKIAVFVAIGLISIWPTVKFIQWGRALAADPAFTPPEKSWRGVRAMVTIEAHLLAFIVVFAALMARNLA